MAPKTGTFAVADLLAAKNTIIGQGEFNAQAVADALRQDNENYNLLVTQALADLVETTSDSVRPATGSIGGDMMEVDEFSRGPTQKDTPGYFIGFPLRKFQFAVGWTAQWERNAKVADVAAKNLAAQAADLRNTRYQIQKAIFTPTNYTFNDINVNPSAALPVKAFINADSTGIQNGPNGEVFDGTTHTHYDGAASLTAAAVTAAIADVLEHRAGARIRIVINVADATAFGALTGFIPLQVPYVTLNTAANQVASPRLEIGQADNRQIGWFGSAEVWTKPWGIQNYMVTYDLAAPTKPLVRRVEVNTRGLFIAAEIDAHPLRAQYIENFYGFGAWNRVALHVLKFNNATYSAPVLSL
jgi:hypothetical protein